MAAVSSAYVLSHAMFSEALLAEHCHQTLVDGTGIQWVHTAIVEDSAAGS